MGYQNGIALQMIVLLFKRRNGIPVVRYLKVGNKYFQKLSAIQKYWEELTAMEKQHGRAIISSLPVSQTEKVMKFPISISKM